MVRHSFLIVIVAFASSAQAGTYIGTANCASGPSGGCAPDVFDSDQGNTIPPFAVTHPPVYDGSGGALVQTVCVQPGSDLFVGPTLRAIDTWNALVPTIENCEACKTWEESPAPLMSAHAETTILHELGHCPLGLQHPERPWDAADDGTWENTSFTRSHSEAPPSFNSLDPGSDFWRGSRDDTQIAAGGDVATNVHWYRIVDNNPFAIDATVIDVDSFSRAITPAGGDLPAGSTWAANANRVVGDEDDFGIGQDLQNTQAAMYGLQVQAEKKISLTADDVNTVQMAMTGEDWESGTGDDYTIELQYVDSCETADVVILLGDVAEPGVIAQCETRVDYSFPQNPFLARHINVIPPNQDDAFFIVLDSEIEWDTEQCGGSSRGLNGCIFGDGFESGDIFFWD